METFEMVKSILQFKAEQTEVQAYRGTTGELTGLIQWLHNSMMRFLWKLSVCVSCSVMSDSATPWTVARQFPLTIFPRQEYWSVAISFSRRSSQPKNQTWVSGSWEYPPKEFIRQSKCYTVSLFNLFPRTSWRGNTCFCPITLTW